MVNGSAPSLSCLEETQQYILPHTVVSECTIAQLPHIPVMVDALSKSSSKNNYRIILPVSYQLLDLFIVGTGSWASS